jgi:hypothetical protein
MVNMGDDAEIPDVRQGFQIGLILAMHGQHYSFMES